MDPISEQDVRRSFVNCSRGEATRAHLPEAMDELPWAGMDFLGWVDPKAPQQAYVVAPREDGLLGVRLRRNGSGGAGRTRMCSICCTVHPATGVSLMVAARAGKAGRDGNTVGVDVCTDLRCSGYVRGWAPVPAISRVQETSPVEERAARLRRNLDVFLARVLR